MKLSLIDRIIIINSILPTVGTVDQITMIMSIKNRLKLSKIEYEKVNIRVESNMIAIDEISQEMYDKVDYPLSIEEISLLKMYASGQNDRGLITESSLDTIQYILKYSVEENA